MTVTALLLAVLCILPRSPVIETRCDVIELNHFYDENGRHIFDQLIYWDWCDVACRFQVRAWRMLKSRSQWPILDRRRGGYVARWFDGERLREVRARAFRETWTQHDPELLEREILSNEHRLELGGRP